MHLRTVKNKVTGREYLSIVQSYRDKSSKQSKSTTIESLGYLDELQKQYPDPKTHFKAEIARMNKERADESSSYNFSIPKKETLLKNFSNRKNFGYAALSKIYHELEIDKFLVNRQRHSHEEYDTNAIMRLLIFSRLLYPASKKKTFEDKEQFFEKSNFTLDDVYRSLSIFNKLSDSLQLWLHERVKSQYNRDTRLVYYDVTNYYFEIDEQDDFRRKGPSKEHRPDPIVQMGLFVDNNGIPITYKLFPGNQTDKTTLIPSLGKIQHNYSLGRIIVVADRGIITGDNIWYTLSAGNGYVLSYSILCADKDFQEYVLKERGYVDKGDGFKIKSRLEPREIHVTSTSGKKIIKTVHEKQVVFYSPKYALKAQYEREAVLQKAKDLIKNPSKYKKSTAYGAAKYIKNLAFDEDTGEILENVKESLALDEERLKKESQFDGYYAILSSEQDESAERILEIYRGLWKIEESFKLTKSDLKSRPVYLSLKEHIDSHFLTCFISLLIIRILEHRLKRKYPTSAMLESLKKAECSHTQENLYVFDHYDDILEDIGKELKIDFSKKCLPLEDIKKILGEVKKR